MNPNFLYSKDKYSGGGNNGGYGGKYGYTGQGNRGVYLNTIESEEVMNTEDNLSQYGGGGTSSTVT